MFHWQYILFHGVAVGIVRFPAEAILNKFGYRMDSLPGVALGLTIAIILLLLYYGIAIIIELLIVLFFRCRKCDHRRLNADW